MTSPVDFGESMGRIEELLGEVEARTPKESLETVRELVRTLLAVHGVALKELLGALAAKETEPNFQAICERPTIQSLLLLHDLHPRGLADRAARTVREVNAAGAHHGRIELVGAEGERVFVRVHGDKPAGAALLRRTFERAAADRMPDAVLDIQGGDVEEDSGLIPAARLLARGGTAAE